MHLYCVPKNKLQQSPSFNSQYKALQTYIRSKKINGYYLLYTNASEIADYVEKNTTNSISTLVSIGDDKDFHTMINAIDIKNKIFGYIPINASSSSLAGVLGISSPRGAVTSIAQRKQLSVPTIKLNNKIIISEIVLEAEKLTQVELSLNDELIINTQANEMKIVNVRMHSQGYGGIEIQLFAQPSHIAATDPAHKIELTAKVKIATRQKVSHEKILNMIVDKFDFNSENSWKSTLFEDSKIAKGRFMLGKDTVTLIVPKHSSSLVEL